MNTEPHVIVTQAPFSTFDHMVIGIVLVVVMTVLGARRLLRLLARPARARPPLDERHFDSIDHGADRP